MACNTNEERGQSTVEYALVLFAFLWMVLALGALWGVARSGKFLEIARDASSHNVERGLDLGLLQDIFAF